jgi:hypothetical protein
MKSKGRSFLFFLLAVLLAPACLAEGHGKLMGLWRLVAYEMELQATGAKETPMGASPAGYILFGADHRMMVVLTGEGRKPAAADPDRAELFKSLVAYTGTYRVEGDKWITKVEVAHNPAWVGTEQARTFALEGERLKEMTAVMNRPDKGMVRFVLTWERVKSGN